MQVTDAERQAIWETLLLRSNNGKLEHGDFSSVARIFHVDYRAVSRIWARGIASMRPRVAAVVKSRAYRRGRKKRDRIALCRLIECIPIQTRTNQRVLQHGAGISCYLVQKLISEGFLARCLKHTRPLLTINHRIDRVAFSLRHVAILSDGAFAFQNMFNVVHIDEKWFYVNKVGQKLYILSGLSGATLENPPVQFVQSKRHILKVMFLCAVARPRDGFNGLIGIWPVVEPYVTQRWSKNRAAGVTIMQPCSIDRNKSRDMLVQKVIPAIKEKWLPHEKHMKIFIQQDNAGPHVKADDPEVFAAGNQDDWQMQISSQPAQSPDLNVLDLGFFNSIQSLQDRTTPRSQDDLITEVKRAFWSSSVVTLNKTFLTLQYMMEFIMKNEGKNDFRLGHLKKDALLRIGELPANLPCDSQAFWDAWAFLMHTPRIADSTRVARHFNNVDDVLLM